MRKVASTHDDDQSMLLDSELSRIDIKGKTTKRQSPPRQFLPRTSNGEYQKLSNDVSNSQRRIAKSKELVGSSKDNHEGCQKEPSSEGIAESGGIICVWHTSCHFWDWRVR